MRHTGYCPHGAAEGAEHQCNLCRAVRASYREPSGASVELRLAYLEHELAKLRDAPRWPMFVGVMIGAVIGTTIGDLIEALTRAWWGP